MKNAPFPNNEKAKYRIVDLFAGIGGTRLGFHLTGEAKVVFSSEINKFARITYSTNFGEEPEGDIREVELSKIPEHEILVAGFPFQSFSWAGKKKGFNDERGALFFQILKVLECKKPKAFLLENVKNLLSHNKDQSFKVIKDSLEELNYHITYAILNSKNFGVPQNRTRLYIVGFNKELVSNYESFQMPEPLCKNTSVNDILENYVDDKYTISDLLWKGHQIRKAKHISRGKGFGFSLFNKDDPYTNAISTRYYKDGNEILIEQTNKNPRKITPREAARLQGFPDNYLIPVSDKQAYIQFGNASTVPVVYAIAKEILKILGNSV